MYSYWSVYISSFYSTQPYILIMVSCRHQNVDFIALTFITKVFKTKLLVKLSLEKHKGQIRVSFGYYTCISIDLLYKSK